MLPDLPQTEVAIIELTNAFRKDSALQQVRPNSALAAAARAFAEYLAKTGKFAHDADGSGPADRVMAHGYRYCLVAENLAMHLDSRGFESRQLAGEMVEGWKTSPGHRENLLLPGATDIGVAVVRVAYKHPKYVSVQLFGRPESLKVTFSIQNQSGKAIYYKLGEETDRLAPRETASYSHCNPRQLSVDRPGEAPARFDPRNGDHFVVRAGAGRAILVDVERK
jgi:hypothetical protein